MSRMRVPVSQLQGKSLAASLSASPLQSHVPRVPEPSATPGREHQFMNHYLELSKADRQGDQFVVEEVQVLEVDQTAKVSWQLLQFVLTQVQPHQVRETAEIRLGPKERTPEPGAHTP